MRILVTGFIVLVIWSFFSMWMYVDVLKPATKVQAVVIQPISENQSKEADSLMKFNASMPKDLMIYFEFDNCKFIPDQQTDSRIAEFKAWMEKYPDYMLSVTGHTDFVGTPEYNQALGLERAKIVSKYLEEKGIPASRMETGSKGKDQPAGNNIMSQGRAKNRRTEISIKK
jgi:outer membrane protein OmpA-like peptidoglycan-associated protein